MINPTRTQGGLEMRKKLVSALLGVAIIATILAGCGSNGSESESGSSEGGGDDKVSLKIMVMSEDSNRQAIYQDYYTKVTEEFPNYDIEFELPGSEDNYNSKLTVYNSSETLPDIFWGRDIVYQAGNALPLTDIIEEDGFIDNYTNPSALIPAPDGEIYCLSAGTDSYFAGPIFYNKDIFEKEGLTMPDSYEGFVELVTTLKEKGYTPISATAWAVQNFLLADLIAVDNPETMGKLQSGEIDFEDSSVVAGVEKLDELTKLGAFPTDVTSIEQQVHEQLFLDGNAAMIYHPVWVYPAIETADFEIGFDYLPEVFGAENVVNAWGSATGGGFMISKDTKHQEAAVEVAEWMVMQDAEYWKNVAGNATAIEGYDTLPEDSPEVNTYIYDKMKSDSTVVYPNYPTNFMNQGQQSEYATNLEKLLTGQMTAEEFGTSMNSVLGE